MTGRPSKFSDDLIPIIETMAKLGATDKQMAQAIGVTEQTFNNWKTSKPGFFESLKSAKDEADEKVEQSLYRLATGYEYDAEKPMTVGIGPGFSKIEIAKYKETVQPSPTAIIFWLKNRRQDRWRDKQELEHSGEVGVTILDDIK